MKWQVTLEIENDFLIDESSIEECSWVIDQNKLRAQTVRDAVKVVGSMENIKGNLLTYYRHLLDYADKIERGEA